jgi:hypothetical protein
VGFGELAEFAVVRVLADEAGRVYLIEVFAKNEKENLSPAERNRIKHMIARIRANLKTELNS